MTTSKKLIYPKLDPEQKVFSTFQVMKILGLKRGRLRQWINLGFISSGTKVAWGESYKIVFSIYALYHVRLFQVLVDHGLQRKFAAMFTESIDMKFIKNHRYKFALFRMVEEEVNPNLFKKEESLRHLKNLKTGTFVNLEEIITYVDLRV
jgi:hypothetical protein